eukprot:14230107-Alexandrium_andersonii.AAC.1
MDDSRDCSIAIVPGLGEVAVEVANSHHGPCPAGNVVEAGGEAALGVRRQVDGHGDRGAALRANQPDGEDVPGLDLGHL